MEPSLTVVLPIHNSERTLRGDVSDLLDAAADLTPQVDLLIVDDASTDDSFDTANELATTYPQVRVLRRPARRGLGETLRQVQASIQSDVVIVHDGASRVNAEQLRLVWRQQQVLGAVRSQRTEREGVSFADLRRPSVTQPAMEAAHRRLMGFQPAAAIGPDAPADAPPAEGDSASRRRDDRGHEGRGVGAIPRLPRTNVLGSITDFALGE